jgi:hypothetical protein
MSIPKSAAMRSCAVERVMIKERISDSIRDIVPL